MFYFDTLNGKKILRSDLISEVNAFFTTREGFDFKTLNVKRILRPNQTHGSNVEIVDKRENYPECDGLLTQNKDEAICLKFADCTPIIFYDSKLKAAGIAHAGWRGTYQRIAVNTVKIMQNKFGSKEKDIKAVIGPAISVCCYEVGEDVKQKLLSTVKNKTDLSEGNRVDLKLINACQLKEIGVEQIDICPFCTSCNNDLFFSYRKENGTKDRHYALISL